MNARLSAQADSYVGPNGARRAKMGPAEGVPEVQRIRLIRKIQHQEPRRCFRVTSVVQHLREREIEHRARTNAAPIEIDEVGTRTPDQVGWIVDFERCA